jgi:hypothetical protein
MFKWAVSEELVAESVYNALTTVRGLERGRSEARETEPVGPVADSVVEAKLPRLTHTVRAMVQVQRLTGARPGEICLMRACDLDMSGCPCQINMRRGSIRDVLRPAAVDERYARKPHRASHVAKVFDSTCPMPLSSQQVFYESPNAVAGRCQCIVLLPTGRRLL